MPKKKQGSKIPGVPYSSDITGIAIHCDLPTSERFLLHLLRSRISEKRKSCWPGQKLLAEEMGLSRRQIARLMENLKRRGIIAVSLRKSSRRHGNHSNEYRFNFPWKGITCDASKVTSASPVKSDTSDQSNVTAGPIKGDAGDYQKCHQLPLISIGIETEQNNPSSSNQERTDDDGGTFKKKPEEQRQPSLLKKKEVEVQKQLRDRGFEYARKAHKFADDIVGKNSPRNPRPYKLKVLESILAGERPDFDSFNPDRWGIVLVDQEADTKLRKAISKEKSLSDYLGTRDANIFRSSGVDLGKVKPILEEAKYCYGVQTLSELVSHCEEQLSNMK